VIYISSVLIRRIVRTLPGINIKLKQAGMFDTPEEFIKKTILSAFYLTTGITALFVTVLTQLEILSKILYFAFPLFMFFIMFFLNFAAAVGFINRVSH